MKYLKNRDNKYRNKVHEYQKTDYVDSINNHERCNFFKGRYSILYIFDAIQCSCLDLFV